MNELRQIRKFAERGKERERPPSGNKILTIDLNPEIIAHIINVYLSIVSKCNKNVSIMIN